MSGLLLIEAKQQPGVPLVHLQKHAFLHLYRLTKRNDSQNIAQLEDSKSDRHMEVPSKVLARIRAHIQVECA